MTETKTIFSLVELTLTREDISVIHALCTMSKLRVQLDFRSKHTTDSHIIDQEHRTQKNSTQKISIAQHRETSQKFY